MHRLKNLRRTISRLAERLRECSEFVTTQTRYMYLLRHYLDSNAIGGISLLCFPLRLCVFAGEDLSRKVAKTQRKTKSTVV